MVRGQGVAPYPLAHGKCPLKSTHHVSLGSSHGANGLVPVCCACRNLTPCRSPCNEITAEAKMAKHRTRCDADRTGNGSTRRSNSPICCSLTAVDTSGTVISGSEGA